VEKSGVLQHKSGNVWNS